ncbi:hypothetical protein CALCODRAFT_109375 [Calocera cornea HHB12733]|uniref:Uncharacterized protein n=1 Tax=Calocera cornea HHB12733 TaxID=1353952 RepID=A0A165D2Y1_9BASI|nr:hypothetical protein CALCODRAFT_109375 [Calocera cornea HHB12733]
MMPPSQEFLRQLDQPTIPFSSSSAPSARGKVLYADPSGRFRFYYAGLKGSGSASFLHYAIDVVLLVQSTVSSSRLNSNRIMHTHYSTLTTQSPTRGRSRSRCPLPLLRLPHHTLIHTGRRATRPSAPGLAQSGRPGRPCTLQGCARRPARLPTLTHQPSPSYARPPSPPHAHLPTFPSFCWPSAPTAPGRLRGASCPLSPVPFLRTPSPEPLQLKSQLPLDSILCSPFPGGCGCGPRQSNIQSAIQYSSCFFPFSFYSFLFSPSLPSSTRPAHQIKPTKRAPDSAILLYTTTSHGR